MALGVHGKATRGSSSVQNARQVAKTMPALATQGRVRILAGLSEARAAVSDLAVAVEIESPAGGGES
ncbi:MAG: hypothetical protein M3Z33_08190 [Actinomycetota bacterium]|nr:hypothetical protein [Actinomycetota bacterium]